MSQNITKYTPRTPEEIFRLSGSKRTENERKAYIIEYTRKERIYREEYYKKHNLISINKSPQ